MREQKGKSLISFPDNYVVIDLETTGLSPEYDSIIEICAIRYINNAQQGKFNTLINPGFEINNFISDLTGITNNMLASAPSIESVLPAFFEFIQNEILVGHNVNFDINFLYDVSMRHSSTPLSNDFIDTLRMARRLHPDERHNRLLDLCERYDISYEGAHRAEKDCLITKAVFDIFKKEYADRNESLETVRKVSIRSSNIKASSFSSEKENFDISHPLYGKIVVFTGALEKMPRREAMQHVADLGGINKDSLVNSTNFLVLGNNDYCKSIKGGKSAKHKKAEMLKLQGHDIEIIPENVFYDMLDL